MSGEAEALRAAVLEVHQPLEAVDFAGGRQRRRQVCTGCGTDDGNWQVWPCPTVRAMDRALNKDGASARLERSSALSDALDAWEGGPTGEAPIPQWWLRDRIKAEEGVAS